MSPSERAALRGLPLGTLIHRAGLLAAGEVEAALEEGNATGRRLGEILVARGLLEERQVAELIAGQKGLPFVELDPDAVDPAARALLPQIGATRYGALAVGIEDGVVVVAIADPGNEAVVAFVEDHLADRYRLVVAPRAQIERAAGGSAPPADLVSAPVVRADAARVVLRLVNGEELELGAYEERVTAEAEATRIVAQLADSPAWFRVDGRYVRPGAIVSLDVV